MPSNLPVMLQVCDDLASYRLRAMAIVNANMRAFNVFGSDNGEANLKLLESYGRLIDALRPEGAEGKRYLAGDPAYPWSRWVKAATDIRNGIAHTISDTSTWGLSGLLSSVVGDTAKDVVSAVGKVADAVSTNALPVLVLVVVGLVALAVIRIR